MLDHYGPIRTLQLSLVFVAAGIALLAQSNVLLGLLGALAIGLGLAPNNPAGSKVLMRTAPPGHRTLIFSIKQAGVPLGGAIAGLTIAPAVLGLGFANAIWMIVAIVVLSAVAVQPFQPRLDAEKGPFNRAWARLFLAPSALRRSASVIRSHPALPLLTAMGVAFSIAQASVTAFTATYMVTQHGKSLAEAGSFVAVLLAASTLSRIFLGWLADRLRRGLLLLYLLSLATSAAILLLVWSAAAPSGWVYVCVALVGATSLGWNGVYMAELARLSPPALIGDVTSAANLFGFVGSVCGPIAFAVIANRTASFDWPFILMAAQVGAFGIFAIWHHRSR